MGFEAEPEPEPTSAPKLSLFSLPNQSPEPTGSPGKPPGGCRENLSNDVARCLELPPRLLLEFKITEIPSPTTVLEGPYITGRSSSTSSASFRGCSTTQPPLASVTELGKKNSSSFKGFGQSAEDNIVISRCSSSVSSSVFVTGVVNGGADENFTKVKITRFRRRESFLSLSNTCSQLWIYANIMLSASIYGTFKQLVPWNRRKINRKLKRKEEEEEEESRNNLNLTTV
ncbi:hypothetical protein MKX01_023053 [Papaver californicum]|nr:hypothetical protein MKX01_023053 [Papaver californicum]